MGAGASVVGSLAGSENNTGSRTGAGDVGNEGGVYGSSSSEAGSRINALDGAVVGESGVGLGKERGVGGIEGVGMVRPGGGETRRSSFSCQSLNSSSSFRHFLVCFSGGEAISGNDRGSGVRVGHGIAWAARFGGSTRAGQSGPAVAALPCLRRRRHFLAAVVFTAGTGMFQVTVRVWCPTV